MAHTPEIERPGYLETITDPTFGTKVTRITGNPEEAIPNLEDVVWANEQQRHAYSKQQPWNCDQSMIFLGRHSPDLWLNGNTYEVLFSKTKPGSRVRWSNTEPEIMYYISSPDNGESFIGKWNVITDETELVVDLTGYTEVSFGKSEGNSPKDGSKVSICAIRQSDEHEVIVVVTGEILYTETERGMPSHFDVQTDQNGDEIIAGGVKTTIYGVRSGTIIKRVLSTGQNISHR